ncbi:pimeloyl-ACP methyl ester carboxylesterase [Pseudoduganella flava]|uniref:Alpha/beta fold hydrolase n=1 Tax=Pseudoduganella flava TaxID=871742 RepID=A0A562PPY9_9BURK|nr:alpha/beta hydrolase [Pseudoduganella flava]QGZ37721.1 alpha/beta fold hydrolase [Pseudoduganella flava]TWI46521.1 pimeloyl-ACP methyl ester carboxylesterase [Pseudoduganella flava]
MNQPFNQQRRTFFNAAALGIAATQLGLASGIANAAGMGTSANAAGISAGTNTFTDIRQIRSGLLNVGYVDMGPANGYPIVLFHGWPYDIHAFIDVAPILASAGYRVIIPHLRGYGTTTFLSADTPRNGQQASFTADAVDFLDALKIDKAVVAGFDWGARIATTLAALWPQRFTGLVSVSGYLIGSQEVNRKPLSPKAELQWWYQYYFATPRGELGYRENTHAFARLIWELASPQWKFDDATFARSARSLDNPDHVAISITNYRWRLGLAPSEPRYESLERRLAQFPTVSVPTITMEGDANGAPHPDPSAYAKKFTGRYEHRNLDGGIGHNLPQEAPRAFAQAVLDVARQV